MRIRGVTVENRRAQGSYEPIVDAVEPPKQMIRPVHTCRAAMRHAMMPSIEVTPVTATFSKS